MTNGNFYAIPMWMGLVCDAAAGTQIVFSCLFGDAISIVDERKSIRIGAWLGILFEVFAWLFANRAADYDAVAENLQWISVFWAGIFIISRFIHIIKTVRRRATSSGSDVGFTRTSIWCALVSLVLGFLLHSK